DGPWAAGERLLLGIAWDGDRALECAWTASAGTFPAGPTGDRVVYEAPGRPLGGEPHDVEVTVAVTDPATGGSRVLRVVRGVTVHAVVVVNDVLGGALTAGGTPVWPPPGTDPLAGARAAGAALRLS